MLFGKCNNNIVSIISFFFVAKICFDLFRFVSAKWIVKDRKLLSEKKLIFHFHFVQLKVVLSKHMRNTEKIVEEISKYLAHCRHFLFDYWINIIESRVSRAGLVFMVSIVSMLVVERIWRVCFVTSFEKWILIFLDLFQYKTLNQFQDMNFGKCNW